jgi:putative membrane protein
MGIFMANFLPLLSTSFIVISAVFVAIGWYQIRKKNHQKHIRFMVLAAIFATLFFIFYVTRTAAYGSTPYTGPASLKAIFLTFLLFHIVLATVGGVMGIITLVLGYRKKFAKHRKIGPWTSIIWFATAITGVTVYYILYVKYPPAEAKPLLDAIFG